MQISIPDDQRLRQRALAAGFATVEDYVLQLVEQDVQQAELRAVEEMDDEKWIADFRAFLQSLPSHNPHFDDSRESIYPVR